MHSNLTAEHAREYISQSQFQWYQSFELAPGVMTPGVADVATRLKLAGIPERLDGKIVLDIGTSNGGVCFEAERRGAREVIASDLMDEHFWGFHSTKKLLGSSARFLQSEIYQLPDTLGMRADVVFCLGVLYHLRHPLLGLDAVRAVTGEYAIIETEIADWQLPDASMPVAWFYRGRELNGDGSNWFAPTIRCLMDWCWSAGFEPELLATFPAGQSQRAIVRATPSTEEPEYIAMSYDRPLRVTRR